MALNSYRQPTRANWIKTYEGMGLSEILGAYIVIWGSDSNRDLQGEYFTKSTYFGLDWYSPYISIPMLYEHGLDPTIKRQQIGKFHHFELDDVGIWAEGRLEIIGNRYYRQMKALIDGGEMGLSSGCRRGGAKRAVDRRITHWPLDGGEISLTVSGVEPRLLARFLGKY